MPEFTFSPQALAYLAGRSVVIFRARYRGCCGGQVQQWEIMPLKGQEPPGSAVHPVGDGLVYYPQDISSQARVSIDLIKHFGLSRLTLRLDREE